MHAAPPSPPSFCVRAGVEEGCAQPVPSVRASHQPVPPMHRRGRMHARGGGTERGAVQPEGQTVRVCAVTVPPHAHKGCPSGAARNPGEGVARERKWGGARKPSRGKGREGERVTVTARRLRNEGEGVRARRRGRRTRAEGGARTDRLRKNNVIH